jgi:tripartite-type tricarboxylate transporter receptor subunit TctC
MSGLSLEGFFCFLNCGFLRKTGFGKGGMDMKRRGMLFLIFFILAVIIFPTGDLCAAPYYQGKTITIIVGTNPGGGYDSTGRIVAKYLPKYIPGNPTVIIQNMPGAGHIIAANYIYNISKPDGMTIGTFNRGLPFAQLSKTAGVKFDMRKYVWIGSMTVDPQVLVIRTELPYRTADDLKKAKMPLICASEGLGTTGYQFPLLLKELAGFNIKIINYLSGADSRLALERKEADARASSYSTIKPYLDRGSLRPILRGQVAIPEIKNLPIDQDYVTDKKAKVIMSMLSSVDGMSRPFVLPPRTPANIAGILNDAFARMAKDRALQEDGRKMNMDIEFTPAAECLKIVNFSINQPEEIIKEFNKYVGF